MPKEKKTASETPKRISNEVPDTLRSKYTVSKNRFHKIRMSYMRFLLRDQKVPKYPDRCPSPDREFEQQPSTSSTPDLGPDRQFEAQPSTSSTPDRSPDLALGVEPGNTYEKAFLEWSKFIPEDKYDKKFKLIERMEVGERDRKPTHYDHHYTDEDLDNLTNWDKYPPGYFKMSNSEESEDDKQEESDSDYEGKKRKGKEEKCGIPKKQSAKNKTGKENDSDEAVDELFEADCNSDDNACCKALISASNSDSPSTNTSESNDPKVKMQDFNTPN